MIQLTDANFKAIVEETKVLVARATAPWCGPCRALKPIFQDLEQEFQGSVEFAEINIDECPEISENLQIISIPTTYLYKDGVLIDSIRGTKPKGHFEGIIKNLIATS